MKHFAAALLSAAMLLTLAACGGDPDTAQESIQAIAMDTVMVFTAYGQHSTAAAYAAEKLAYETEALLSRTDPESDVSRLNSAPADTPVELDGRTAAALEAALAWSGRTDGAFDCTLAQVSSAWGFTEDTFCVPGQEELAGLLEHTGFDQITLNGTAASHAPEAAVDLGGIAQGWPSDEILKIFQKNQVPRGRIELGGNICVIGDRPDGSPWRIGIQDPADPLSADAFVGILHLTDAYTVTSGGYQRYFEEDGKTYHHIIDPATGYPAENGLVSVTVEADAVEGAGAMCDALSTALFVMGEEQALEYWRSSGYEFELVLVTEDGRVLVTEGLADRFTAGEDTGYRYVTVS